MIQDIQIIIFVPHGGVFPYMYSGYAPALYIDTYDIGSMHFYTAK